MRNRRRRIGLLGISLAVLCAPWAHAAVPGLVSYQGKLNDSLGNPVSGTVSVTFRLYSVDTGGTALWSETQALGVSNGIFSVNLGSVSPLSEDLFEGGTLFLGIQVGADSEMTPRQQLGSASFAMNSPAGQNPLPIGTIVAWAKNLSGVPALPPGWAECNGQVLSDPDSPLNGISLPNLNAAGSVLRGSTASGGSGPSHSHTYSTSTETVLSGTRVAYNTGNFGSHVHSGTTDLGGVAYEVVFIVKTRN